jgi:hypothetical protein
MAHRSPSHRCPAAGEEFHAFEDASDERDVAIELARRMTDHRIHLGAVTLGRIVASGAHHTVAMREPHEVRARIARGGKAVEKSDLRRIGVAIRQGLEARIGTGSGGEFHRGAHAGRNGAMVLRIIPLHHVVVLHANDRETIEIMPPGERANVGSVPRRHARGQLDDDPSARKIHVQRVFGVGHAPVRGG